ncbi:MAG: oligosaccharide flippase family protein [Saprospiraceae bacterium]
MSAVKSGLYSLGGGMYKVMVGIIGIVVFARLIGPGDHGVYVYILAIHMIVLPFLDFGLLPAYLKIEKINKEVDSVFFTLNVAIGIILTLVVITIAPLLAWYKENPMLLWYIITYSSLIMIISLGSQPSSQLIKQKRFKEIAIIDSFASTVALIAGVVFALWGWAVWALLLRFIIDVTVKLALQYYQVKPSYFWVSKKNILKYWNSIVFGAGIAFSRIITGLTSATDKFLFEEFYGKGSSAAIGFVELGQYGKAADATAKADLIRNSLTTPALSYLTDLGLENSRKYYFDLTLMFFFITSLPILFFAVYGDLFTLILMGDQWEIAATYSRYFAFYGAGLTMRGLVNIYHINEFKSTRLYKLNMLFFILLYSSLASAYFVYDISTLHFVQIFSFFTFGYWLIILIQSLFAFTGNINASLKSLLNIVIISVVFIRIGLWLRQYFEFSDNLEIVEAGIVGLISLITAVGVYFIIDHGSFMRQVELVYSRIGRKH